MKYIFIFIFLLISMVLYAQEFNVEPTFNSAGIYWIPADTSEVVDTKTAEIYYKTSNASEWKKGYELYWLPREDGLSEFRGSLVHLASNTKYDLKVVYGEQEHEVAFTTWNEEFKVKKIIQIDPTKGIFKTTEGGNAQQGYVVYEPIPGSDSLIDAQKMYMYGIEVNHDWVILRGWKIKNVRNHPIHLYPRAKFVVIEYCEISQWGTLGKNFASDSYGIYINGEDLIPSNIIIQYCYFHDPAYDTNNWSEQNDKSSAGNHPGGTQPIYMLRTGGKLVIRYNTFTGSEEHYYNDGMGEWRNFGPHGFPFRDSDIYNNYISHCWDNAIESEGANMNVRIYNNYIDSTYAHMGLSNITFGPLYLFNNVSHVAHKFPSDTKEGNFLKIGNKLKWDATTQKNWPCVGRAYVFNNTILQPVINGEKNGLTGFTTNSGPANGTVYLNNIMHMTGHKGEANKILSANSNCVVNYNLYSGGYIEMTGAKNIYDTPQYISNMEGFYLKETSPGYQTGTEISNFLENDNGIAPDMGAYQNGQAPIQFGCGYAPIVKPGIDKFVEIKEVRKKKDKCEVKCYPNPFVDEITIEYSGFDKSKTAIELMDASGRILQVKQLDTNTLANELKITINTDLQLNTGLYFIKIANASQSKTIAVTKE